MRTRVVLLAASLVLAAVGFTGAVFAPSPATAAPLEKVGADFTIGPGQSANKTITKLMVNSAELRPNPSDCRHSPVFKQTCDVQRIKLVNRTPGYFLRITTSWLSQSAAATAVPDVDTYLFDDTESDLGFNVVGGASGAMPELIKVVEPTQDEYDFVMGVYLGAVTEYKVLVEYINEAAGPTPAPADFVLSPKAAPLTKKVTTPMVGYTGAPVFYPLQLWAPDECRNDPTRALLCDVYRLKLNRNRSKEATNFVVFEIDFQSTTTPDVVLPLAGLSGVQIPNIDIIVWDSATHSLERTQAGGQDSAAPERAAFTAIQDEYDIVVQLSDGVVTEYTIRAYMSDEIFDKPFEFLDPETGQPVATPPSDTSDRFDAPTAGEPTIPGLELAPIDVDDQIAGIGLGTTEQFDRDEAIQLGREALRNTSVVSDPPSGLVLLLALLVVPLGLLLVGVWVMRRRHTVAF